MKKLFLSILSLVLVFSLATPSALAQKIDDPYSSVTELTDHVPGEVLIRFSAGTSSAQAADKMAEMGVTHKREIPAIGVHLVKLPPGLTVEQALDKFSHRPGLEFVEPNYILQITAPNHVEEITDQWGLEKIEAVQAWDEFTEQNPITLATVDTGVDFTHTDLADNRWSNSGEIADNGLDDDANGYIDDTWGWDFVNNDNDPFDDNLHGTAVSSVMAGVQDGSGVAGVCPWCQVMAVKVMSANGTGTQDAVANGIIYAANSGARVINLSLAGSVGAQTLENAVNYAWNQGVLVVGGAGNAGTNAPMYPAGYANVMAVGSTGEADTHSCFSNYAQDYISVVAPGENILVALPDQGYGIGSGTSLSTPHVTGLAGLLFSQNPALTNTQAKTLIENTSVDLGPAGVDAVFGHGRIDAFRAVTNDQSQTIPPDGLFSISDSATGYAHARKLVRDSSGRLHLIWHTQDSSGYRIRYTTSIDNGDSWDLQPDVFSSTNETYHPALAADEDYLYVAIPSRTGDGLPYQILFTRKPLTGGTWSTAESIMGGTVDTVRPDLYVDPSNGRLHVIASSLDNAPDLYYRASNDQGENWEDLSQFNPSNSTSNTRYAAIHANGDNIYVATKTVSNLILFTYYYLYTARSTDGGQTWVDKSQLSYALASGEYGLSLAGVGDRVYMGYGMGSNLYFRRYDGAGWGGINDYLELEKDPDTVYKWPTITQSADGQSWLIFEVNKQLYMRHYDGATWGEKESIGNGSYANLKLGAGVDQVEWVYTTCNGSPFDLGYGSLSLGVNSPPTAVDDSYSTDEDATLNVDAPGVLGNDSDPESDPLTAVLVSDVSNGNLSLNSDGSFSYIPDADFNGTDSFTYHANDGTADSNTATVSITVNPVANNSPVATDDNAMTNEDIAVTIDVLANDSDVDGDSLTVDSVIQGSNGTVANNGTDVTYTPGINFNGTDSFTYTVSDGNGGTDTATVSVTVSPVNDAPSAADDDSFNTDEDIPLNVAAPGVLANDSDPENDPLTAVLNTGPSHGSLTLNGNGSFTYTSNADFNGSDSFTYHANDGTVDSNLATVTITVNGVNDAPTVSINTPGDDAIFDQGDQITFTGTATDTEDGDLTASLSWSSDLDGSIGTGGTFSTSVLSVGTHTITAAVNDSGALGGSDQVVITVNPGVAIIDALANNEISVAGTVDGNYTDTHQDGGLAESITERQSGGKPSKRYSYLEHKWIFDVTSGNVVILYANAWSSDSGDGDSFTFAYSTDDNEYTDMFFVDSTSVDNLQTYTLPSSTQGIIYIRVKDSDHNIGHLDLDTIFVDHMYISSETQSGSPPAAPSDLSAVAISVNQIDLTWTDKADDEDGFYIERSEDGSTWNPVDTAGADMTAYTDSTVFPSTTYYYRVQAYNASGSSAYSNTATATTPAGLILTGTGYKVKGVQTVDLIWSGSDSQYFEVYRDGNLISLVNSSKDGYKYTDDIGLKGNGSYQYQVCEAGGSENCSNIIEIIF